MTTEFVPYLAFDGECETAFKFYEKALRGEIVAMLRLADAPPDVPRTPETARASCMRGSRLVTEFSWAATRPPASPRSPKVSA